ncbi:hypothetical protein CCACVL1_28008 [Corchorus capsularis]|uniref:Uncharacterized protein n=1 Tax=Corchorus capsularis TaxID=210143 RepID=A0A1R3G7Y4_COCAP|nr:hypothetical protein CCACVL1_28008 [Corchorus capsularis]
MEGFCFKEPHRLRELLLKTLEKPIVSRNAPRKNIHRLIFVTESVAKDA